MINEQNSKIRIALDFAMEAIENMTEQEEQLIIDAYEELVYFLKKEREDFEMRLSLYRKVFC